MTEVENYKRLQLTVVVVALLSLAAVGVGLGSALRQSNDLSAQAKRNSTALKALCFQRQDIDKNIVRSRHVLLAHPRARLIFGFPRALIQNSLSQSIQTRRNLSILECKE